MLKPNKMLCQSGQDMYCLSDVSVFEAVLVNSCQEIDAALLVKLRIDL